MRTLDLSDPLILDQSLVVSASAGSGKTFTLTVLVTARLGRGDIRPWEILATTFSETSAADLRERLLRPLDMLSALDEAAWQQLLPHLEVPVATDLEALLKELPGIQHLKKSAGEVAQAAAHWSCAPWLGSPAKARAFWRRVRREAELLQVSTIHSLAMRVLSKGEGSHDTILDVRHPSLLRLLRLTVREALTLPTGHADEVPARLLLAWAEQNWEELSQGFDNHLDALGHLKGEDPSQYRDALTHALAGARNALAPFAADAELAKHPSGKGLHNFKKENLLPVPVDSADLQTNLRWAQAQSGRVSNPPPAYYSDAFCEAMAALKPVATALEAWLRCLLVNALQRFEAEKQAQGLATFGDLVRQALDSLKAHGLETPAPKLLLVDEYQDTSKVQDAFLEALGAERMVRVGDVKQAIYGFRGGDPDLLRDRLAAAGEGAFRLASNFRSTPEIVTLANTYVDQVWPQLDPTVGDLDGAQVPVAPSGPPVGLVRTPAPPTSGDLPALADWISGLSRESGWTESLGARAKTGSRTRALLLKQRTRLPGLLQRLKAQGIQPYVVAKEGFWDSPGVRLILAALEAVAHPERPIPCAALLRQVVGLSDAELATLAQGCEGRPGLPGLGQLDPERLPDAHREAARFLLDLRQASTQTIAGRLLRHGALLQAIAALNVHGALEPLRARRNLAGLLAKLQDLPASPSVAYALLDDERNGLERGDLPASVEDADLLIQTAHGSKGLEYDDVILPLLNVNPRSFRKGDLRTRPETGELLLAWKLGTFTGRAYDDLKPLVEAKQKRDELNLLYVALTRAKGRLCVLLQEPKDPKEPKPPSEFKTWAKWGQVLASSHLDWKPLAEAPTPVPVPARVTLTLDSPPARAALADLTLPADAHDDLPGDTRSKARQEGEAMHAFLRDLLVRWEDPEAFQACLAAAPPVAHARENALRFLEQFEAKGWRHFRRRTELPLAGAASSGGLGRADLVVWGEDRIHLLDFKHSKAFGEEELAAYRDQLNRYSAVLAEREGMPVTSWLVPLRGNAWVNLE
ncbi:MAG: UvrD-helicase domain-containing protein [Geothrix sp.]|uniref:UvrD-helicase domain-containing protein n=1 Tax=Geothrix sp. TaxID=1962974 RepID=UPI001794F699|nr:UvrD-helicase domain-containing protein [Geothrix sp.]NWJ41899.1 UvrD-helicase domain-containing protein [Geothrix sp.]WIL20128.1 MAG: UvrD-helicase domain-containing protein [Geothrix sp.]